MPTERTSLPFRKLPWTGKAIVVVLAVVIGVPVLAVAALLARWGIHLFLLAWRAAA